MDILSSGADAQLGQGCHGGTGAGAAGPCLAAAALPHTHLQVGGIHHLHKLGVDALREVFVVLKARADLLQLQAVHLRHNGHAMGVAHADAGHPPQVLFHLQGQVYQRSFAHVHGGQRRRHGGVGTHLHLPQPLAHAGNGL